MVGILTPTFLLFAFLLGFALDAKDADAAARWPGPMDPCPEDMEIRKEFHATVDVSGDMWRARSALTRRNVENFMLQLARLGITRVYWIAEAEDHSAPGALSDDVEGIGMLRTAVRAAHRAKLSIYALYKPFETGCSSHFVPQNVGIPPDLPTVPRVSGRAIGVAPFVAKNPHLRIKRKPTPSWSGRMVNSIKLIKSDASPTRLGADHLSVWVSKINGRFSRHRAKFRFRDGTEQRGERAVRVLTLDNLQIKPEYRYLMVRSQLRDDQADFRNVPSRMMEIHDSSGQKIPSTWDEGPCARSDLEHKLIAQAGRTRGRYVLEPPYRLPEDYGRSAETTAYYFNTGASPKVRALDGNQTRADGQIVLVKGKDLYLTGGLHPICPEVRQYWLKQIQTFIDAGVDGIDIRVANHSTWACEGDQYGFNEPVVAEYRRRHGVDILTQPFDREKWKQLQGEYYTRFLREVRALTKRHAVAVQLHINGLMGLRIRWWERNNVPVNCAWEWEKWIREDLCDSVTLKYIPWEFGAERGRGVELGERVARLARERGKRVFSHTRLPWWVLVRTPGLKELTQSDLDLILAKIRWGWQSRLIDGIVLYETMAFMRMYPDTGAARVSPVAEAILGAVRSGTWTELRAKTLKNYCETP